LDYSEEEKLVAQFTMLLWLSFFVLLLSAPGYYITSRHLH